METYSQLSIHEKINKKQHWISKGEKYETISFGWYVMKADAICFDLYVS